MKDNGNASGEAHTYAPKNDEYKDAVATQPISRAPGINRTTPLHSTLLVLRQASPSDKEGRRHSPSPPPSSLLFDPRDDNGTKSQDNGAKTRDNATKTNVDETEDDENGWEQLIASGESDSSMFALDSHHDEEEEEGGRDVKTHRDKRGDSAPGQLGIEPPREEVSSPACSRAATSPSVVSVPNDNSLSPACRPQTRNQRLLALCNAYFGEGSLSDWQRLMADLGFERDFTSKNQCRKVSE
ncbi:hypothetical protein SODALDRAFT_208037 [Sodiomyces alkalinus F11]|uniref:Uncharacterized protein n=1 Tax=Sodiomyces alkalinus (strain CBS 110278 / VKM F-3762 / F11) TaxID=1314773 RepID=A0A3N2PR47_SODAK|nr:hypothetical protein SODALDRAFT_208037 [Sodiomyces alkalinus F11]ROT36826.1 hypothetical protein SODALDRAFT_208037 [Sodiomyces alkalinus F11]